MDDNRKLAEELWRVAQQQPGGNDVIDYIAAALKTYGEVRYKEGQEAAEAACQSLREQSSRWEAQALEAGMRIAELEAQVRGLREIADQWDADKETLLRGWFAAALIRAALAKPQEVKT